MKFSKEVKECQLKGNDKKDMKLVESGRLKKMLGKRGHLGCLQLWSMEGMCKLWVNDKDSLKESNKSNVVDQLFGEFCDVFEESIGLPPERAHDHRIPLKEGSFPINRQPYHHSSSQKDVIERMTNELLDSGII